MLQTQKNRLYKLKTTLLYAIVSAQNPIQKAYLQTSSPVIRLVLHQTLLNQSSVQGFRYGLVRNWLAYLSPITSSFAESHRSVRPSLVEILAG